MKKMKKILALVIAMVMVLGMSTAVFAAGTPSITINPNNDDQSTASVAIDYTYYKILSASIDTDPTVAVDGSTTAEGKASYYVENQAQATAIAGLTKGEGDAATALFTVTQVPGAQKWYVTANEGVTAQDIVDAFDNDTFLANFTAQTYTKAADVDAAVLPNVTAGYYFIKSSLGTKAAVQTLSPVTINEKNTYPGVTKTKDDASTLAGIGDTVTYTVTVSIPESVAEKDIKVVDTITNGLTLNTTATVTGAVASPAYTSATFVQTGTRAAVEDDPDTTADETVKAATIYTITIPAATVIANKGKTLTFTYTAVVNENAKVLDPEENTAHLEYDKYTTVETEVVDTKTLAFSLEKVDGTDFNKDPKVITELAGAEFSLWTEATGGTQINLVDITAAGATTKTYRVATAAEAAAEGFTSAPVVAGTATIEGLNDTTYYLQEDKEPTGYNKLTSRVAVTVTEATSAAGVDTYVENNKGTTLPSTGGMGTTIFYIIGAILVIGAGVVLVTRRRMNVQ